MKKAFCCNYLSELDELIKENKVDVNYVKFPSININQDMLNDAKKLKPVVFHALLPYDFWICQENFAENINIEATMDTANQLGSPHYSAHITAKQNDYPNYSPNDKKMYNHILSVSINNANYLNQHLNLPLLLENLPFIPHESFLDCISDTEFICKLIRETGSYFLFDISHARQAAYYRGIPYQQYIDKLPLDRLTEVHLSGITMDGSDMYANHTKMNDEDYELLEYLLKNTPIKLVTLEYGPIGLAAYNSVNPVFKQELYEQIIRVQEILYKCS